MNRFPLIAGVIYLLACPALLHAEEQVTLKSGARLMGSVTLSGQTVNVNIGDSAVSVIPLSDIDLIGPVGTESKPSPERLLMIALEARTQQGSSAGQVGVLAEAYRQAPEDARIAYWYAHSLVDAGLGHAARAGVRNTGCQSRRFSGNDGPAGRAGPGAHASRISAPQAGQADRSDQSIGWP